MTDIEWCQNEDGSKGKTWNPTRGCSRVGPECDNCYAMNFAHRFSNEVNGKPGPYRGLTVLRPPTASRPGVDWTGKVIPIPEMLRAPFSWRTPQRVFVDSMSDLFHESLGWERDIDPVFDVMGLCERHRFMVLTKRAQNMRDYVSDWYRRTMTGVLPNVWLGVSCGNKGQGLPRLYYLRDTPAAVRFLSIEPLLEDLGKLDLTGIDWVIVGGESGNGARPFQIDWARSIVEQCAAAGVACFVKQLGAQPRFSTTEGYSRVIRGELVTFRSPKGGDMNEWPEELRVRQFPEVRRA